MKDAIIKGQKKSMEMESNVAELIKTAANHPQKGIQIISGETSIFHSYSQIYQGALRYLGGMQELGVEKGNNIVMLLKSRMDFVYVFFAAMLGGCKAIPIAPPVMEENRTMTMQQLIRVCSELKSPVLVSDLPIQSYSNQIAGEIITVDQIKQQEKIGVEMYGGGDDIAIIQFTSGSMSEPKGVVLEHQNVIANIYATIEAARLEPTDRLLNWLPYHHNFALICFLLTPIKATTNLVCMEATEVLQNPVSLLTAIDRYEITFIGIANFACKLLLRSLKSIRNESFDLSGLNGIINGSEFIEHSVLEQLERALSPYGYNAASMMPSYGLSEGTCSVCNKERDETVEVKDEIVTLGSPVINAEIKIIGSDGHILQENEVGAIAVKGPGVMKGYLENGKVVSEAVKDGWYETDDIGFISNRKLYIKGRRSDSFVINGNNYYIKDIEKMVRDQEGIEEFCILCEQNGSVVDLYLFHAQPISENEVNKTILTSFGVRVNHFISLAKLPRTNSLKINYNQLRQMMGNV